MKTGATKRVSRLSDHERLFVVEENVHLFIASQSLSFQLLAAPKANLACVTPLQLDFAYNSQETLCSLTYILHHFRLKPRAQSEWNAGREPRRSLVKASWSI